MIIFNEKENGWKEKVVMLPSGFSKLFEITDKEFKYKLKIRI